MPLAGLEPTDVTAYDQMPNLLTTRQPRSYLFNDTYKINCRLYKLYMKNFVDTQQNSVYTQAKYIDVQLLGKVNVHDVLMN